MELTEWLILLVAVFAGIGGLFLAAGSEGGATYLIGLLVFAAAVVVAFARIKRHFDRADARGH